MATSYKADNNIMVYEDSRPKKKTVDSSEAELNKK